MRTIKNNIVIKMILLVLIMIFLGYILKAATYSLPSAPMKQNMKKCVEIFVTEGKYHVLNAGYKSTRLDNYTDAIMILTALYDDEQKNIFEKTAGNYRITCEGKNPVECLASYLEQNSADSETEYARYWHGYLVLLKPILLFFDYSDIRVFNMIAQSLLVLYLLLLLYRDERLKEYMVPLFVSILVLNPHTISYSMQYSWVYYLVLISSIIVINKKEYFMVESNKLLLFFTLIGIMTSFLDLLTWPLATCAIPLVFVLIINKDYWFKKLIYVIKCTVSWGVGYIGMWCGCWIISTISLEKNIFKDAIEQVIFRTSNNISADSIHIVTTKEVFRNQFFPILKWPYFIILLIILIGCCYKLVIQMRRSRVIPRTLLLEMIPFLLICIMPFAWFTVTRNHSFLHYTYTWRNLMITIFAGLAMIVKLKESLINREN